MELQHDKAKECQTWWEAAYGWKSPVFGGQGDLTQVCKTEDGGGITTIHTFLGEITKLNKNNKYRHATGETAELKFWQEMVNDEKQYNERTNTAMTTTDMNYTVGTKVLVQVSLKQSETVTLDNSDYVNGNVGIVAVAEAKPGDLTGASDAS